MERYIKENKVLLIIVGVVFALIFAIIIGKIYDSTKSSKLVDEIVSEVSALYEDETKVVLAEGTTMDMVVAIEEKIDSVEEMAMTDEVAKTLEVATTDLEYAKQMVELRDMSLALLDDNGVLVDGADVQAVQDKADALAPSKPEWVKLLQMQIDEAKKQQDAIVTATQYVNALFTDETLSTVRTDVTRLEYNTAQESVDVVKNKASKDVLQQSLNTVDAFLDEQEEKVQAENVEQEQSVKDENTSNTNSDSNISSGTSSNTDEYDYTEGMGDEPWSAELEVDFYTVNQYIMDTQGNDITDSEVYDMNFETEEEMFAYMEKNYPGCAYSYTIHYKEIW